MGKGAVLVLFAVICVVSSLHTDVQTRLSNKLRADTMVAPVILSAKRTSKSYAPKIVSTIKDDATMHVVPETPVVLLEEAGTTQERHMIKPVIMMDDGKVNVRTNYVHVDKGMAFKPKILPGKLAVPPPSKNSRKAPVSNFIEIAADMKYESLEDKLELFRKKENFVKDPDDAEDLMVEEREEQADDAKHDAEEDAEDALAAAAAAINAKSPEEAIKAAAKADKAADEAADAANDAAHQADIAKTKDADEAADDAEDAAEAADDAADAAMDAIADVALNTVNKGEKDAAKHKKHATKHREEAESASSESEASDHAHAAADHAGDAREAEEDASEAARHIPDDEEARETASLASDHAEEAVSQAASARDAADSLAVAEAKDRANREAKKNEDKWREEHGLDSDKDSDDCGDHCHKTTGEKMTKAVPKILKAGTFTCPSICSKVPRVPRHEIPAECDCPLRKGDAGLTREERKFVNKKVEPRYMKNLNKPKPKPADE